MEDNDIIQRLRTFPAGEVYYIAPKDYFVRGYEYYRQGRLVSLSWDKDCTTLIAGVRGSRLYDVSFYDSLMSVNGTPHLYFLPGRGSIFKGIRYPS